MIRRTLKLFADGAYPTSYDEEEIRIFTLANWPFFYKDNNGVSFIKIYITVLWPNIHKYLDHWNETKSTDFWAAGDQMAADLVAARVAPPQWPPKDFAALPRSDENVADDV